MRFILNWLIKFPLSESYEHRSESVATRLETSGSRGKKIKHFFLTSCITQTLNEQLCTWSLLLISINLKIKRWSPWNAENAHFEDITFYLRTLSSGILNWRSDTPSFVYSYNSKFYGSSNHLFKISSKRIACHGPLVILVLVGRCRRKPVFQ